MRCQVDFDDFVYPWGDLATVSGGKWTNNAGIAGVVGVENNCARGASYGIDSAAVIASWTGNLTDQYAQCVHRWDEGGLTLRSDDADTFILVDFHPTTGVYIFEVIDGALNLLGDPLTLIAPLLADDILYAEVQGSTILAKQNEQTLGIRTATGAIASGKPGVFLSGTAFRTQWSAGDFTGANPVLVVALT